MMRALPAVGASLLAVALSVPPMRSVIEQSMAWHMVFQMPLLVAAGAPVARAVSTPVIPAKWADFNLFGLTGFMAAQGVIAYWMLPLAIDRAVVNPWFDVLKLLTLFVSGAVLRDAFQRAPMALQLFFIGYWVSMMCWLGIYFVTTDLRLCNAYSLESQIDTGWGLLALGLVLGMVWLGNAWQKAIKNPAA
jgi:hypothetical protein